MSEQKPDFDPNYQKKLKKEQKPTISVGTERQEAVLKQSSNFDKLAQKYEQGSHGWLLLGLLAQDLSFFDKSAKEIRETVKANVGVSIPKKDIIRYLREFRLELGLPAFATTTMFAEKGKISSKKVEQLKNARDAGDTLGVVQQAQGLPKRDFVSLLTEDALGKAEENYRETGDMGSTIQGFTQMMKPMFEFQMLMSMMRQFGFGGFGGQGQNIPIPPVSTETDMDKFLKFAQATQTIRPEKDNSQGEMMRAVMEMQSSQAQADRNWQQQIEQYRENRVQREAEFTNMQIEGLKQMMQSQRGSPSQQLEGVMTRLLERQIDRMEQGGSPDSEIQKLKILQDMVGTSVGAIAEPIGAAVAEGLREGVKQKVTTPTNPQMVYPEPPQPPQPIVNPPLMPTNPVDPHEPIPAYTGQAAVPVEPPQTDPFSTHHMKATMMKDGKETRKDTSLPDSQG